MSACYSISDFYFCVILILVDLFLIVRHSGVSKALNVISVAISALLEIKLYVTYGMFAAKKKKVVG